MNARVADTVTRARRCACVMAYFPDVVALRRKFFSAPYPADTIAEIKALYDPRALIEIEAIAAVRQTAA